MSGTDTRRHQCGSCSCDTFHNDRVHNTVTSICCEFAGETTRNIAGSMSVVEEQIGDIPVPHVTPSVTECVAPELSAGEEAEVW